MKSKMWVIYDNRAYAGADTDNASVYEAFLSEYEGDNRHYTENKVLKIRDENWPEGWVYEYEIDNDGTYINEQFIG